MTVLHLRLEGDGAFPDHRGRRAHRVDEMTVTGLPAGTNKGRATVAIIIDLADGSFVFAQTTLRLFLTAADALKARYGDPREEPQD